METLHAALEPGEALRQQGSCFRSTRKQKPIETRSIFPLKYAFKASFDLEMISFAYLQGIHYWATFQFWSPLFGRQIFSVGLKIELQISKIGFGPTLRIAGPVNPTLQAPKLYQV